MHETDYIDLNTGQRAQNFARRYKALHSNVCPAQYPPVFYWTFTSNHFESPREAPREHRLLYKVPVQLSIPFTLPFYHLHVENVLDTLLYDSEERLADGCHF